MCEKCFNILIIDDSSRFKIGHAIESAYDSYKIKIDYYTDYNDLNKLSDIINGNLVGMILISLNNSKLSATDTVAHIRDIDSKIPIITYKSSIDKIDLSSVSRIINYGIDGFFDIHDGFDISDFDNIINKYYV